MRTFRTLVLTLALCSTASVAYADPEPDAARKEAMRKYEEGSKAFQEKRYKDAIDLFLAADEAVPNADLAYNTSLAYDAMGDAANALRWAREYLRRSPNADDRADVEKRIGKLEQRLKEKGVQQVTVLSTPAAATVYIDDRAVGVTPWTGELLPGSHRVEVRLDGYEKANQLFELRPDRALDVKVEMKAVTPIATPEPTPTKPSVPPTTAPSDSKKTMSPLVPVGASVFGVGLAGIGAAIGLEVARAGAEEDARLAPIQVDARTALDRMESYQLGARIAVGVGAGLAATGVALFVAGIVSPQAPKTTAMSLGCDGAGCGAALRTTFH